MTHGVLVIEDETTLARNIKVYLERHNYDVRTASTAREGLQLLTGFSPEVVLLDLRLPDLDGLQVLARIREQDTQVRVILITAHGDVQTAVQAMKTGAYDYLHKPLVLGELKILLDKVVTQTRLEGEVSYYRAKGASEGDLAKLLGESPPMQAVKDHIQHLLEAEQSLSGAELPPVLISGETGTGKELVARALHYNGLRREQPFVEVNCASIPLSLLEAELFGYEQGAFTDAKGRKPGLIEAADGGTLFLDEIGDIDPALQVKLLKVLEDKIVRRLGSVRDRRINVRILTATNQPLETLVRQGRFRSDLYFRLRVISIVLPPLRERRQDILLLARHFLQQLCRRYGKHAMRFSPAAENTLLRHHWPGNVRELRNVMEETVLLARQAVIKPEQLGLSHGLDTPEVEANAAPFVLPPQGLNLEEIECNLVRQALERTTWNVTRAAKLLGLSRDTLRYRIEKYRLRSSE